MSSVDTFDFKRDCQAQLDVYKNSILCIIFK